MRNLKRLHNVQLELLRELDCICRKNNISYFLFAGSALGAIRHQGFIPWDDDVDVVMLRPEYERFLDAAERELDSKKYFLQREFSPHWPMFFSKLRANDTTYLERYPPQDWQTHMGIYIDIFPCDNLSDKPLMRKLQFAASKVVIAKSLGRRGYVTNSIKKRLFIVLCRLLPLRPFYTLVQLNGRADTKMVHTFLGGASSYTKSVFPREWFEKATLCRFEDGDFPVPSEWDALLHTLYGDYMQLPSEGERACKVHAVMIDCEHSHERYEEWHRSQKIETYERSIR